MHSVKIFRASLLLMALVTTLTLFNSCKRNTIYDPGTTFDNSQTTQGTIFGQIVAEDGSPIKDADVKVGSNVCKTDNNGVFHFSKITTAQNATLITVTKANYFTGYRTLRISTNKDHYTRIMMIEMKNAVTFNAITGGTVNVNGGGSITFPANSVVYKSNGTPYNGTVTMYSKWLDPTGNTLNELMPGDLRAIDANNAEKILASFGMMGVELFDNSNTPLQLATGKTAKLSFPIPSSLAPYAPNSIPFWYFDAVTGMWKEDGSATKQGNSYVGDVKHFTWWNCDIPGPYVNFDLTLTDNLGSPLSNLHVRVTNAATTGQAHGYTNGAGMVTGNIPANATLTLDVLAPYPCNNVIYTQTVTTLSSPISLGTVIVTVPSVNLATITGTVLDCSGNPVSNGYVGITTGLNAVIVPTNATGAFNASLYSCTLPASSTVTAYDMTASESGSSTVTLNSGMNNLGALTACGTQFQYITWTSTVSGIPTITTINEPFGLFYGNFASGTTSITAEDSSSLGSFHYINFTFNGLDLTTGAHDVVSYQDHLENGPCTTPTTIPVTVTSYQAVGGYISGSFTGAVSGGTIPLRTITCNFKVKRQ